MAITVQQMHPVAHLPLVLGVLRRLEVATLIDGLIPPHPAHEPRAVSVRTKIALVSAHASFSRVNRMHSI